MKKKQYKTPNFSEIEYSCDVLLISNLQELLDPTTTDEFDPENDNELY